MARRQYLYVLPRRGRRAGSQVREAVHGLPARNALVKHAPCLQPAAGIAILQKAITMDPYNPLGYEALTVSYLMTGKYAEATALIRKALKIFPENRLLRLMLSKIPPGAASP